MSHLVGIFFVNYKWRKLFCLLLW